MMDKKRKSDVFNLVTYGIMYENRDLYEFTCWVDLLMDKELTEEELEFMQENLKIGAVGDKEELKLTVVYYLGEVTFDGS